MIKSIDKARELAAKRLATLDGPARLKGFIRAALFITIAARDSYEVGTTGLRSPERLRASNELLHRLLGAMAALSDGEKGYPDEVIANIIFEMALQAGIDPQEVIEQLFRPDVN